MNTEHSRGFQWRPRLPDTLVLRGPLWVLAAIAIVEALRAARELFVPLVLALLVALVLSGVVERMRAWGVPRIVGALAMLSVLSAGAGGIALAVWSPAQQWTQDAPRVLQTIERRIRPVQAAAQRIDEIAGRVTSLATPPTDAAPAARETAPAAQPGASVVAQTGWAIVGFATILALALLLLAAGPPTLAQMTAALANDLHASHVLRVIDAIRVEVGRYYRTLALINLGLGVATATVTWLLGMPNPALWGAVAGVLNFVPYLGSVVTMAILAVVALATYDTALQAVLVPASFLVLATVEGQIIQPVLVRRRLELNPIVVFLALWTGWWMWGIAGVVSALPVLVAVKVAAAHSDGGDLIVRFLGPVPSDVFASHHSRAAPRAAMSIARPR
jgi:predicted PurR-regulated permease PerM